EETATDWDIVITQADIENLIRAKGSIYSAAKVLLDRLGMTVEEIDQVYIGGGLGNHLNVEKAITIGLLPDLPAERYAFIGNSSLAGSRMFLLSRQAMGKAEEIADRMMNIELCSEQAYMSEYVSSLFLPHTDISLFPTVKHRLGA
ncbi:MAG: ASKHA domain-containing protein, partial [Candidatus Latescibacteria bacterium]|nr:ASKHA domain-containing protein [Candidatus Latescibacterota bacterium]